jgi:sec-independent protein translocase protein TatB
MFSFSEIAVIAMVALIVIGPERMPRAARTVGHLLARLQRYVNGVKADISREMQLEDLKKLQKEVAEQAANMKAMVGEQIKSLETSLNEPVAQETGADNRTTTSTAADAGSAASTPAVADFAAALATTPDNETKT